jgi:hypothetical protein
MSKKNDSNAAELEQFSSPSIYFTGLHLAQGTLQEDALDAHPQINKL